jgi:DNA-binding beta-propeller fold protein YncE
MGMRKPSSKLGEISDTPCTAQEGNMKRSTLFFGTILILLILAMSAFIQRAAAALPGAYFYPARRFRAGDLPHGTGLAYDASREMLLALKPSSAGAGLQVQEFDRLLEDALGEVTANIPAKSRGNNPRSIAFDPSTARLVNAPAGLEDASGAVIDASTGILYLLDSQNMSITAARAEAPEPVRQIHLHGIGEIQPAGLALNPNNGHFYTADEAGERVFEIDADGQAVAVLDLAAAGYRQTGGMVFAPSGDETDDPAEHSLYIVAARTSADGQVALSSQIVELTLVAPPSLEALAFEQMVLVRIINAYAWEPSSPDTSGIAYWPAKGGYLISDGEVEDYQDFTGDNLYQMNPAGALLNTFSAMSYSDEPTGVAVNGGNGEIYISDDVLKRVFVVNPGPDGALQTGDDKVTSFRTINNGKYNSPDPEGVGWGVGLLFIVDGTNSQVYVLSPGANGKFDGVASPGDDVLVRQFDTEQMGVADPEGIDYNPQTGTLFIAGNNSRDVLIECTIEGEAVRLHNISSLPAESPAGIGIGPSSSNPSLYNVYMSDRGTDVIGPNTHDGKIFEISLSSKPSVTLTPSRTPTNTPTPTPRATAAPVFTPLYLPFISTW